MTLHDLVRAADNIVVFTGAGISTESGIPDFRSPGGLWTQMKPIYFDEFVNSEETRKESWRRRFEGRDYLTTAEPNAGHIAVARLVAAGKVSTVITQNIDNLHQNAGVPAEKVIEIHGNATYAKCLSCAERVELDVIRAQYRQMGTAAPCEACGGLVKSATISFGQAMPEREMRLAEAASGMCDLFLAIGSSLTVYPAAGLPILARRQGAKLVILNRDETELDPIAHLVINDEIGPTLSRLMDALGL